MKTFKIFLETSEFSRKGEKPFFGGRDGGNEATDAELIKHHKNKLAELKHDAPKSHREYHERYIRKLEKRNKK